MAARGRLATVRAMSTPQRGDGAAAWPGRPFPLGAHWDGEGANFALWTSTATGVEVCLFDPDGRRAAGAARPTPPTTCGTATCPASHRGSATAFGSADRTTRHAACSTIRTNCSSTRTPRRSRASSSTTRSVYAGSDEDSAPYVPRCVLIHDAFPWGGDRQPNTAWADTVIYELHVRGFTMRHPDIPPELRGTYAGLAHPAAIEYLTSLGVTAVELMPIHQFVSEPALAAARQAQLLGLQLASASSPRTRPYAVAARQPGARVQGDGARAARGRASR